MSNKQGFYKQENSSNEPIEISIPNDEELFEKEPTHELGEADDHIEVVKINIIEGRRTLHMNKNDEKLYDKISESFRNNPNDTIEDTISKFGAKKISEGFGKDPKAKEENHSDALAKVVHNYPLPYLPDFIIRYKDDEKDDSLEKFERLLLSAGLILEHEIAVDGKTYIKVVAPFEILRKKAQKIKLKMRLNDKISPEKLAYLGKLESETTFSKIIKPFTYTIDHKKVSSYFNKDQSECFMGSESELDFFKTSRRNLLVHGIITKKIKKFNELTRKGGKFGIFDKFDVSDKFDKFYPVHDGPSKIKNNKELDKNNLRAQLNKSWVKGYPKCQPLKEIREYFGEKVALYFAWLGIYTSWLSVASIAGAIVVIYGLIYGLIDVKSGRKFGDNAGISILWDNVLTAPYALLMAVGTTCYLEGWKRANASIQYDWDVTDYETVEPKRPEFRGTTTRMSPITLKFEVHFPSKLKIRRLIVSGVVVLISIGIVIVTIGVLLRFQGRFSGLAYMASVVSATINLITTLILNFMYKRVAKILTNYENHETDTQYEDSYILKAYLFDFINFYSALIYMMFNPADCSCSSNGCDICDPKDRQYMRGLTIQLAIILIGKQLFAQILEVLYPRVKRWVKGKYEKCRKSGTEEPVTAEVPQWVQDYALEPSKDGIRAEYKEIVIQFGFIALFGVAFPLAPLCAFMNNVIEIRTDAFKYIKELQRPVGFRAQDLGMWEKILKIVSFIAILTNAIIIAFHSLWMENQFRAYVGDEDQRGLLVARLGFIFAFGLLIFVTKLVCAYMIPDVPETVKTAIKREGYLAAKLLDKKKI